jgi:GNAT superfamily N-acetyltransferase
VGNASREPNWTLSQIDRVLIRYTTEDRFWSEHDDDDIRLVQRVEGEVVGEGHKAGGHSDTVPLGILSLARIELAEVGDLPDLLDHDADWYPFTRLHLGDENDVTAELGSLTSFLLILERIRMVPQARGHGLGLHVLARAIRTWGVGQGIVGLVAGPFEEEDRSPEACEALARYWKKLGFPRLDDGAKDPLLYQTTESAKFYRAVERYSRWTRPA